MEACPSIPVESLEFPEQRVPFCFLILKFTLLKQLTAELILSVQPPDYVRAVIVLRKEQRDIKTPHLTEEDDAEMM